MHSSPFRDSFLLTRLSVSTALNNRAAREEAVRRAEEDWNLCTD